jgi:hypothetical protein
MYAESVRTHSGLHMQVIGKSDNFYWAVQLLRQKNLNRYNRSSGPELQGFALFNSKLDLVREDEPLSIPGIQKQWLLAGKNCLDQILLTASNGTTRLFCCRYYTDGQKGNQIRLLDSLPFITHPSAFLLIRSADHSKILLAAFDNSDEVVTRLHALLFDAEWHPLYHQVISHSFFSQPCIQDDEISFPGESFDNLPIKLANNGEWLMAAPSCVSRNFSLFHVCSNGSDYQFREIPISPYYQTEDVAMSIDNDLQEMSVGVLTGYPNTSLKNVQITNYSIAQGRFDFDTSYRFSTQTRGVRNKNLSQESFMAVPGGGYLLMKEYGLPFEFDKMETPFIGNWEAAYFLANYTEPNPNKSSLTGGYSLNPGLRPIPFVRNQGDLNLFYFPAVRKDSTWSGSMIMEQQAESNNPDLSYLMVPDKDKLYMVYNNLEDSGDPMAMNTTLNRQGKPTGDELIFWKVNKLLNFQQAHRFAEEEIAVPYLDGQKNGFAIIRLE